MSILCGWASSDENGRASGGAAGDQTGREVKTGAWYSFGQTVVLRCTDRTKGREMASIMRKLCNNKHVGYDQGQRTTLWSAMARAGYNPDKITTDCETDCSAMIAVVCKAVGYSISKDVWTGNLKAALIKTGAFTAFSGDNYVKTDKNLMAGDIILNPERHVIMALEDGANVEKDGWVLKNGSWYFYRAGEPVKNEWQKDSKDWCYLGKDGKMVKNAWQKDSVGWCYLGADGRIVRSDWRKDGIGWCYLDKNGHMLTDTWLKDDGKSYFLKKDGHMTTGNLNIIETFDQKGIWRGGRQA